MIKLKQYQEYYTISKCFPPMIPYYEKDRKFFNQSDNGDIWIWETREDLETWLKSEEAKPYNINVYKEYEIHKIVIEIKPSNIIRITGTYR